MVNRRRTLVLVLVLSLVLAAPAPASAHPADMHFQWQTINLTPDAINLVWSIAPGPLLVPSIWDAADQNFDGVVSQAEARAWAAPLLAEFTVALDATRRLAWDIDAVEWPSSRADFQTGNETIRIHLSAGWPAGTTGAHQLALDNRYESKISVNWFTVQSAGGVGFHTPDQQKGVLSVEFAIPGDAAPLTYWDSGTPSLSALEGGAAAPPTPPDTRPVAILTGMVQGPEMSPVLYPVIFIIALALGAVHALTPGHGKALVGAYLVGSRGTMRHAAALGGIVTLTHTGSVLLVGALTLVASRFLVPTSVLPVLEIASGLLIVAMGAGLLRGRWRGYRAVVRSRVRRAMLQPDRIEPGGARVVAVNRAIPVAGFMPSVQDVDALSIGQINWRSLVGLGVSGGMVPCPDAIAILLVAITINRIALGLMLIAAFSFGLALVLVVIGIAMVRGRRLLERFDAFERIAPALPALSALVVVGLGAVLTAGVVLREALPPEAPAPELSPAPAFDIERAGVLYVAKDGGGFYQVFTRQITGGDPIPLTEEPSGIWQYALSPDQTTIVYTALRDANASELWAVRTDGTSRRRLLACEDTMCGSPVWSPDGRRLIYERQNRKSRLAALWWLDIETGETQPVFRDEEMPGANPRWSPDGKWLSYVPPDAARIQIYNLADGTSQSVPTRMGSSVVWRPDSAGLLLNDIWRQGEQGATHLLRFDLATGQLTDLTGAADADDTWAAWSPDGEWIAFVRKLFGETGGKQIWLMRADGSDARALTHDPDMHYGVPVWSPDGAHLLAPGFSLSEPNAQLGIWRLDIATGERRLVVEVGMNPAWLP
ncbi:MAG: PD40 domain-containing protein [Anaerolineae bacterium]|nr:PD40 domain-containing protein [Anaerolineae bacterium]